MAEKTRWLAADMTGDGRIDLVHIWSGGINTLKFHGDGTYELLREGWTPHPGYPVDMETSFWLAARPVQHEEGLLYDGLVHVRRSGITTFRAVGGGSYVMIGQGWLPYPGHWGLNPTRSRWRHTVLASSPEFPPYTGLLNLQNINGFITHGSMNDGTYEQLTTMWLPRAGYSMDVETTRWVVTELDFDGRTDVVHVTGGGLDTLRRRPTAPGQRFDPTYDLLGEGWKPRPDYDMGVTTTRWIGGGMAPDGRGILLHISDAGINTFCHRGDGTYDLTREGWKPRRNYAMNVTGSRWLSGDLTGDGTVDLVHIWDGGINTFRVAPDGQYRLLGEGWKPRPDYSMNVSADLLED